MTSQKFTSIWDAIEDTPAEAENMRLRAELMRNLDGYIRSKGLDQAEAAKLFGVTQPRISELQRGKINLFSLDKLVSLAAVAGLHVELSLREAA